MASSARAGVPASRRAAGPPSSSRLSPRLDARIATARRPRPPASASLASASAGRGGRGFPPRHPSRPRERVRANALEAEDAARPRAASSSSYAAPSGARAPNPPLGGRDARARDDADDDGDPLLRIVPPSSRAAPGGGPPRAAGRSSAAVVRRGASLADYCTLGVGGEARALVEARTSDALRAALASARRADLPVVVIGRGSNVLFHDEGFEGVVVVNKIEHVERVLPNAEEDDARTNEDGEEEGRLASSGASSKASSKEAPQKAPPREAPPQKARFRAGAGCAFHQLGAALSRAGWSGLEFAVGIPGTVGGAVFMNAGADGRETRDALVEIEAVSPDGRDFATIPVTRFSRRDAEDAFASAFGYRTSPFMEEASASSSLGVSSAESSSSETNENASASSRRYAGWIVTAATFELTRDPNAAKRAAASIRRRRETQPLAERSTGCAFRNPGAGADSAGALIDRSGLKGAAIGRASVSKAHANFLLVRHHGDFEGEEKRGNDDGRLSGGGSREYSALIARVRAEVFERTGVWLEEEVRRVGRFGVERAPEKPLSKETRAREEGAAGDERSSEERRRRGDDDDDETRRSARVAAASDAALEAFLSAAPGLAEGPGNAPPNPRRCENPSRSLVDWSSLVARGCQLYGTPRQNTTTPISRSASPSPRLARTRAPRTPARSLLAPRGIRAVGPAPPLHPPSSRSRSRPPLEGRRDPSGDRLVVPARALLLLLLLLRSLATAPPSRPPPHRRSRLHRPSRRPAPTMAAFTANPLSLSMSNEAVGAWVKDTKAEEEREARRRRDRSGGGASGSRGGSSRGGGSDNYAYKTPYLTVSDLRKPPAPWREFLCADDVWRGYAFPRSVADAKRRLDANAFTFLGNYRTAAFAVVCCVLYNDPRALVGAVVVARMWDALGRANANEDPRSFNAKFKRSLATIVSWGVGAYCKVTVALSFAIVLVAAMIAVHGSLRRLDAPKPDYGKSPKRVKSHLGRLTRDR